MGPLTARPDVRADVVAALRADDPAPLMAHLERTARLGDLTGLLAFAEALHALLEDVHARLDRGDQYALADAVENLTDRVVADALTLLDP